MTSEGGHHHLRSKRSPPSTTATDALFLAAHACSCVPYRYPNEPVVHTALGHLLLSKDNSANVNSDDSYDNDNRNDSDGDVNDEVYNKNRKRRIDRCLRLDTLERATASFRRAIDASKLDNSPFVPATRGLAVALCRHRLMLEPTAAGNALHENNNDGEGQEVSSVLGVVICYASKRFRVKNV